MTDFDRARQLSRIILADQIPRAHLFTDFELTLALFLAACDSLAILEKSRAPHLKESVLDQQKDLEMALLSMDSARESLKRLTITCDASRN